MFRYVFAALLFVSNLAQAAILLEPYAGYSTGALNKTLIGQAETKSSDNGLALGGRGGLIFDDFFIVAYEYQQILGTEKLNGQSSLDWSQGTQFATLGFQAPYGLRFMGSYGFVSNANESGSGMISTKFSGTAYKLALGLRLSSDIAINAEYTVYNMSKMLQNGVRTQVSDTYSKFNETSLMVNLSFPIALFGGGHSSNSSVELPRSAGGLRAR